MRFLIEQTAKELFGYTYYFEYAFYLTPEGRYLDGSDKQGKRVLDHRDIQDADDAVDYIDFMLQGNIRLMPESPGIDMIIEPTEAQYKTLESYIRHFLNKKGEFYIDISNEKGYPVKSFKFDRDNSVLDIIYEIKDYFN